MAENILPDGDVSLGGWTTQAGGVSNLYQAIDETTLNASDFIQSATNPVVDTYEFTFSNPSALLASGVLNIVAGKKLNNAAVVNLRVQLLQSTTLIAEWLISDLPYTPALSQFTLTTPQLAAITDPTLLRGKLIANPAAVSVTFAAGDTQYFDDTGLTTRTATGMSFPNPEAGRVVGIVLGYYQATNTTATITIGGVSASKVIEAYFNNDRVEIWTCVLAAGTTANVVGTWTSGGPIHHMFQSFSITGASSATPSSTSADTAGGTSGSVTVTIPTNGVGVAGVMHENDGAITWSAGTQDLFIASGVGLSAGMAHKTASGSQALAASWASSGVVAGAAWGP